MPTQTTHKVDPNSRQRFLAVIDEVVKEGISEDKFNSICSEAYTALADGLPYIITEDLSRSGREETLEPRK